MTVLTEPLLKALHVKSLSNFIEYFDKYCKWIGVSPEYTDPHYRAMSLIRHLLSLKNAGLDFIFKPYVASGLCEIATNNGILIKYNGQTRQYDVATDGIPKLKSVYMLKQVKGLLNENDIGDILTQLELNGYRLKLNTQTMSPELWMENKCVETVLGGICVRSGIDQIIRNKNEQELLVLHAATLCPYIPHKELLNKLKTDFKWLEPSKVCGGIHPDDIDLIAEFSKHFKPQLKDGVLSFNDRELISNKDALETLEYHNTQSLKKWLARLIKEAKSQNHKCDFTDFMLLHVNRFGGISHTLKNWMNGSKSPNGYDICTTAEYATAYGLFNVRKGRLKENKDPNIRNNNFRVLTTDFNEGNGYNGLKYGSLFCMNELYAQVIKQEDTDKTIKGNDSLLPDLYARFGQSGITNKVFHITSMRSFDFENILNDRRFETTRETPIDFYPVYGHVLDIAALNELGITFLHLLKQAEIHLDEYLKIELDYDFWKSCTFASTKSSLATILKDIFVPIDRIDWKRYDNGGYNITCFNGVEALLRVLESENIRVGMLRRMGGLGLVEHLEEAIKPYKLEVELKEFYTCRVETVNKVSKRGNAVPKLEKPYFCMILKDSNI